MSSELSDAKDVMAECQGAMEVDAKPTIGSVQPRAKLKEVRTGVVTMLCFQSSKYTAPEPMASFTHSHTTEHSLKINLISLLPA